MYFNSMVFPVEGVKENERAGHTNTVRMRIAEAARVTDGHTEENILNCHTGIFFLFFSFGRSNNTY